jgi:hypothetical protein
MKVRSYYLGYERGCLTLMLHLEGPHFAQGYGGRMYGTVAGSTVEQAANLARAIHGLCTVFNVECLDDIVGKSCNVHGQPYITAISTPQGDFSF